MKRTVTFSASGLIILFALLLNPSPSQALIPQPVSFYVFHQFYLIPYRVNYNHNAPYCFTLHNAIRRLLESFNNQHLVQDLTRNFQGNITLLNVRLSTTCNELMGKVYPSEDSREDCKIHRNYDQLPFF